MIPPWAIKADWKTEKTERLKRTICDGIFGESADGSTRLIRPTMHPHIDGMIAWCTYLWFFINVTDLLKKLIFLKVWKDQRTYRRTDSPAIRDAFSKPSNLLWHLFSKRYESVTDERTNLQTPGYRDENMPLNNAHKANDASSGWWNDCTRMWSYEFVLDLSFDLLKKRGFLLTFTEAWQTDWRTNGPINCLIEMMRLDSVESVTDRRTDGRMDGQTLL